MDLKWSGPPENCEKWSRVLTKISYASSVQKKALTGSLQPQHHRIGMDVLKHSSRRVKVLSKGHVLAPLELHTYLLEIANLVNQRPIGRVPNDPDDGIYICPNDILLGRATSQVPQGPFKQTKNLRHRVEFVQRIVESFWKRWKRDVFPALVPRRKWRIERRNVRIDDVVTVTDENAVRGSWTMGRIVDVFPGADGKVRNVKVKTAKGVYSRPVTKIAVIYPAEG